VSLRDVSRIVKYVYAECCYAQYSYAGCPCAIRTILNAGMFHNEDDNRFRKSSLKIEITLVIFILKFSLEKFHEYQLELCFAKVAAMLLCRRDISPSSILPTHIFNLNNIMIMHAD
jgi:hypothetical protein